MLRFLFFQVQKTARNVRDFPLLGALEILEMAFLLQHEKNLGRTTIEVSIICLQAQVTFRYQDVFGAVAQLGEHPVCTRKVAGSSPVRSTMFLRQGTVLAFLVWSRCHVSLLGGQRLKAHG